MSEGGYFAVPTSMIAESIYKLMGDLDGHQYGDQERAQKVEQLAKMAAGLAIHNYGRLQGGNQALGGHGEGFNPADAKDGGSE